MLGVFSASTVPTAAAVGPTADGVDKQGKFPVVYKTLACTCPYHIMLQLWLMSLPPGRRAFWKPQLQTEAKVKLSSRSLWVNNVSKEINLLFFLIFSCFSRNTLC